jgi:hypothetical protein
MLLFCVRLTTLWDRKCAVFRHKVELVLLDRREPGVPTPANPSCRQCSEPPTRVRRSTDAESRSRPTNGGSIGSRFYTLRGVPLALRGGLRTSE